MATKIGICRNLTKVRGFSSECRNLSSGRVIFNKPTTTTAQSTTPATSPPISTEVPGLSSAVVNFPKEPVGPGASKQSDYKNPEYFCYNQASYFEAEIEMLKYRCPQPSSKK